MKKIIYGFGLIVLCVSCERRHYYCLCQHPVYYKYLGTQFTFKKSQLEADCNTHKVDANTSCNVVE